MAFGTANHNDGKSMFPGIEEPKMKKKLATHKAPCKERGMKEY